MEGTSSEGVKHQGAHPGLGNPEPGAGRGRQGGWGSIAACRGGPYPLRDAGLVEVAAPAAGGDSRGGMFLLFGTLGCPKEMQQGGKCIARMELKP